MTRPIRWRKRRRLLDEAVLNPSSNPTYFAFDYLLPSLATISFSLIQYGKQTPAQVIAALKNLSSLNHIDFRPSIKTTPTDWQGGCPDGSSKSYAATSYLQSSKWMRRLIIYKFRIKQAKRILTCSVLAECWIFAETFHRKSRELLMKQTVFESFSMLSKNSSTKLKRKKYHWTKASSLRSKAKRTLPFLEVFIYRCITRFMDTR